ncbi:MAG TPA: hypothetical protein PKI46_00105 [Bacteroidales bacterium]|nr:hypothetical protein [Bacteroidales bacterium]
MARKRKYDNGNTIIKNNQENVIGMIHKPKEEIKEILDNGVKQMELSNEELNKQFSDYVKEKIINFPEAKDIKFNQWIKPEAIIEYVNPEFKLEKYYQTDGSLAFDIVNREEILIPCNNFFKQTENIIGFLFDKLKDIYTGNMKAEHSWDAVETTIRKLNNDFNKYHHTLIPMNIKIQYPENYGSLLIPRSSTFKKYGLMQANSIGLIDSDYCLEHGFPVINLTNKDVIIPANTRIAQIMFIKKEDIKIVEGIVNQHNNHDGHGSTDKK